jgi:hypothetical protein
MAISWFSNSVGTESVVGLVSTGPSGKPAKAEGVGFISTATAFAHHELCTAQPYLVPIRRFQYPPTSSGCTRR